MTPSTNPDDSLQWVFLAIAGCIVLYHMLCGWQRGVGRQSAYLVALGLSYMAAWFGGGLFVPMLRPLGYPDLLLQIISGAVLAVAVFFIITFIGRVAFKKTSQHEGAMVRFRHGISGAMLGVISGMAFVWMALLILRVLGTVAQSEITASTAAESRKPGEQEGALKKPNVMVFSLAEMKRSVENGAAGDVVKQVDPIPKKVYAIIDKITVVLTTPEQAKRFMDFPGAQALASNPKITALRDDPDIAKQIKTRDFMGLLKNEHLVSVVNDPALYPLLKKFELEKALDYSQASAQKDAPAVKP